jgi:uncharacterized membrane protein YphA (DoxX/SURF4 family)
MKPLPRLGRYLFAAALAAFGIQHLLYAKFGTGLGPPWILARPLAAWLLGAILIVVSITIVTGKQARAAASAMGAVLLIYVVVLYTPRFAAGIHNPGPWTSASELLCISGATLVLAGVLSGKRAGRTILLGRVLFALPLLVFAVQHFLYAGFIATLIPAWIPARLFFAYFVGVAFVAATISIAFSFAGRIGATLLGIMFFIWVLIVHTPRVVIASHNANEWTSLLVALAMCGGSWAVAGSL